VESRFHLSELGVAFRRRADGRSELGGAQDPADFRRRFGAWNCTTARRKIIAPYDWLRRLAVIHSSVNCLTAVFDSEAAAFEGLKSLVELHMDGDWPSGRCTKLHEHCSTFAVGGLEWTKRLSIA
jgi:hypothetical protein